MDNLDTKVEQNASNLSFSADEQKVKFNGGILPSNDTLNIENEGTDVTTPVLEEWYRKYIEGNKKHPEHNYGFFVEAGAVILDSLSNGKVDLAYVAQSGLSREQLENIKETVTKIHRALKVHKIPEEYAIEEESPITDDRFVKIWNSIRTNVLLTTLDFMTVNQPYNHEMQGLLEKVSGSPRFQPTPEDLELLGELSRKPEFSSQIQAISTFYDTASHALNTPEAKRIAMERRHNFNYSIHSRPSERDDSTRERMRNDEIMKAASLTAQIRVAVSKQAAKLHLPPETAKRFVDNTTTLRRIFD